MRSHEPQVDCQLSKSQAADVKMDSARTHSTAAVQGISVGGGADSSRGTQGQKETIHDECCFVQKGHASGQTTKNLNAYDKAKGFNNRVNHQISDLLERQHTMLDQLQQKFHIPHSRSHCQLLGSTSQSTP